MEINYLGITCWADNPTLPLGRTDTLSPQYAFVPEAQFKNRKTPSPCIPGNGYLTFSSFSSCRPVCSCRTAPGSGLGVRASTTTRAGTGTDTWSWSGRCGPVSGSSHARSPCAPAARSRAADPPSTPPPTAWCSCS